MVESYPSTAHPTPARNTSWKPQRLQEPLASGGWKRRNERQAFFGCWGGLGPNLSVLSSFPHGWDQGVRRVQVLRHRSGRRRPKLEANWEIFVPQVRGKWPSPGSSPGAHPKPVGGTSRGRRIRLGRRKHTSAPSPAFASSPHSVQKFLNSFPRQGVILRQKDAFFPVPFRTFTFSVFGYQAPGRVSP